MATASSSTKPDSRQPISFSIGPLFPRFLAAYVGIIVVIMFWGMVFASPNRYEPASYFSYAFGLVVLLFLFLPASGTLEIKPDSATLSFRESVTAWALHFWRSRKRLRFELTPGSKVQFGSWMKDGGFVVSGLQVSGPDGNSILVFEDFSVPPNMANILIRELTPLKGVSVLPVKISREYQTTEWRPEAQPRSWGGILAFGYAALLFGGLLCAILGLSTRALTVVGVSSVLLYAVFRILIAARTVRPAGEEKPFTAISIAFSVLYFALTYAVLTLVGRGIVNKQP